MDVAGKLDAAIRAFSDVLNNLAEGSPGSGVDWQKQAIDTRRQLGQQIFQFSEVATELGNRTIDKDVASLFRAKLSQMRHYMAMHQSEWPVVRIDQNDQEYRASLSRLRTARQEFVATSKQLLEVLQKSGAR